MPKVTDLNDRRELSPGEKMMGVDFNPSGIPAVNRIKADCAHLCDVALVTSSEADSEEAKRMFAAGITRLQEAQMWFVKALTWKHGNVR